MCIAVTQIHDFKNTLQHCPNPKCYVKRFSLLIFSRLITERENAEESYSLEMSVCEIYNNEVRDLLAGKNASRVSTSLRALAIRQKTIRRD